MLPAVCAETGETYALKYLFHALEGRYDDGVEREESLERQMRALRLRVPTYRAPRRRENAGDDSDDDDDDDDVEEEEGVDNQCGPREPHAPYAWEVATASDVASGGVGPYGVGAPPARMNWEMIHLALLKTTFVPAMREHVKRMPRRTRRVYERTFELEKDGLTILDMDGTADDIDVVDGRVIAKREGT